MCTLKYTQERRNIYKEFEFETHSVGEVGLPPCKHLKSNISKPVPDFLLFPLRSLHSARPWAWGSVFPSVSQATEAFIGTLADLHLLQAVLCLKLINMYFLQLFWVFFVFCWFFPHFFYLLLSFFTDFLFLCSLTFPSLFYLSPLEDWINTDRNTLLYPLSLLLYFVTCYLFLFS